jgi:hypothetical protein
MVKTLELAISKAANLSEAAQEQLGRELLERIDALAELRAEIEIGLKELDAGLGEELDIEALIREARDEYARKGVGRLSGPLYGQARFAGRVASPRARSMTRDRRPNGSRDCGNG